MLKILRNKRGYVLGPEVLVAVIMLHLLFGPRTPTTEDTLTNPNNAPRQHEIDAAKRTGDLNGRVPQQRNDSATRQHDLDKSKSRNVI